MEFKITNKNQIRIFAYEESNPEDEFEIKDLYWFEENSVREWDGWGISGHYFFRIVIEESK
jgi:hypothetical protein